MEKVANTNVKPQAQANAHAADKDADFKAKKAAAAKAFAERQKKLKEDLVKFSKEICEKIIDKNPNAVSKECAEFFKAKANPVVHTGSSRVDFFTKVFGEEPKVGQSITVLDYMKKTLQSKKILDNQVKAWAEKGIIVEFTAKDNQLESTYTIKKLA